jgi:hypothetical protein
MTVTRITKGKHMYVTHGTTPEGTWDIHEVHAKFRSLLFMAALAKKSS